MSKEYSRSVEEMRKNYNELLDQSHALLEKEQDLLVQEREQSAALTTRLEAAEHRNRELHQYVTTVHDQYAKEFPDWADEFYRVTDHMPQALDKGALPLLDVVRHDSGFVEPRTSAESAQSFDTAATSQTITIRHDTWPESYDAWLITRRSGNTETWPWWFEPDGRASLLPAPLNVASKGATVQETEDERPQISSTTEVGASPQNEEQTRSSWVVHPESKAQTAEAKRSWPQRRNSWVSLS